MSREQQGKINKNGLKETNKEKNKSHKGSLRERDGNDRGSLDYTLLVYNSGLRPQVIIT